MYVSMTLTQDWPADLAKLVIQTDSGGELHVEIVV